MDNRNLIDGGAHLEPAGVWSEFAGLNAIPRPSKKEEQIRAYLKNWLEVRGIAYREDAVGNLLAYKPAFAVLAIVQFLNAAAYHRAASWDAWAYPAGHRGQTSGDRPAAGAS